MPKRPRAPIRWLAALGPTALAAPHALAESLYSMQPSPQQTAWQEVEFGVIAHFGTHT
ncbi:hypothetical protein K8O61_05780 [Xanthomonas cerealis pv. cerealis]|uniref:hypothetical protein n=1 Tax=Xanthomonas cerealis TaxID=3390025 RepID=UPI001F46D32F|nr:hypothetical protein [Xanthomonas translucens]UKE70544.1 hypothetical protein K8O61_05780 [Xanthomonas translucens pv. pistacia]